MFRECCYFSLALDTAQFGRENFLSCVARFGFKDKISQEILLFEKINKTTGHELARFLFDRLVEKNCDFKKLISITTDGASNMTGQTRGMANEMVKLVNENCGLTKRIGVDIHCIWCIDHRLNLVAQDFKEVKNINFVIKFIKWITAGDRLVSYTALARSMTRDVKKKKIPPPSETRWLFFRDTLRALLDQTELVDEFLNINDNREKWIAHTSNSKYPWVR